MMLSAAFLAVSTLSASAVTFATAVDWANNGTVPAGRDNPNAALGAPDGPFLSLGLTNADGSNPGFAVFTFGGPISGSNALTVIETTFVCNGAGPSCNNHFEEVEILIGQAGEYDFGTHDITDLSDFVSLGFLGNADAQGGTSLVINGAFTYIAFIDRSLAGAAAAGVGFPFLSSDGFDIESIAISIVPVPASLALMLTAIGGLGLLAARRRAA